jgi:hypothetical protein
MGSADILQKLMASRRPQYSASSSKQQQQQQQQHKQV